MFLPDDDISIKQVNVREKSFSGGGGVGGNHEWVSTKWSSLVLSHSSLWQPVNATDTSLNLEKNLHSLRRHRSIAILSPGKR